MIKQLTTFATSLLTVAALCASSCTKAPSGPDLSGEWTGWGKVVITGTQGTYADTYGTGPGTFKFKQTGERAYEGTWGESSKRHGVLSFTASEDGRVITGTWKADDDCAINPGTGGSLRWKRRQ